MPAYREFLVQRHREYHGTLRRWVEQTGGRAGEREAAIASWRERIARIEAAMQREGVEPDRA